MIALSKNQERKWRRYGIVPSHIVRLFQEGGFDVPLDVEPQELYEHVIIKRFPELRKSLGGQDWVWERIERDGLLYRRTRP